MAPSIRSEFYHLPIELYDETFVAKVGPEAKCFTIHQGIASYFSSYFEAALKQDTFKEGRERCIELRFEHPEVFSHFVRFLYNGGRLPVLKIAKPLTALINLYLFADRRQVPLLCNIVVDEIIQEVYCNRLVAPTFEQLDFVLDNTTESSPLRRLLISLLASNATPEDLENWKTTQKWSTDVVWMMSEEILRAQLRKLKIARDRCHTWDVGPIEWAEWPFQAVTHCEFHMHLDGQMCDDGKTWGKPESSSEAASEEAESDG